MGCGPEIERIVNQIRAALPEVRTITRWDSGFCRNQVMNSCESHEEDYVFGMARNQRLLRIIGTQMREAPCFGSTPARICGVPAQQKNTNRAAGTGSAWGGKGCTSTARTIRASS